MRRAPAAPIAASRKPIVGRFSVFMVLLCLPSIAGAQIEAPHADQVATGTPLTADEAVRRALARAPLADTIRGAIEAERGAASTLGAYPNPQVSYLREQTFGALGTGEDYLSVSQVIDLGNRRGLRGEAGERRANAAVHEGAAARVEVAADARLRFYETLHRQERATALRAWIGRIEAALTIVGRRTARGDTALYDRRRLERERIVAEGRAQVEEAARDHARARLAALVGLPDGAAEGLTLEGRLLPDDEPAAVPTLRATAYRGPRLQAVAERLRAADLELSSATRWWLPDLRLEAGWKGVDAGSQGRTDGFLLGATLTLPLWDASGGLRLSASGEARALGGRRALLESELAGEVAGLHAEATRLARAARRFREDARSASADLVRIATAGYQGGEMTLLELLDAYRGAGDDELTALDLDHAARRARIGLDRTTATEAP